MSSYLQIFTLLWHLPAMKQKQKNTVANISNECHWSHDGQIDIDFSKIFALRFTRFTRDPCLFISQCKQKSALQSLIEKQVITIFIVIGIVRATLDLFSVCFCRF